MTPDQSEQGAIARLLAMTTRPLAALTLLLCSCKSESLVPAAEDGSTIALTPDSGGGDATANGAGCVGRPDGGLCDDGNACTLDDRCAAGTCVGSPCSTDDSCLKSVCVGEGGCQLEPQAAGEACEAPCFGFGRCDGAGGCAGEPSTKKTCPPPESPCVEALACDSTTGECAVASTKAAGTVCDSDDDRCTPEACGEGGQCQATGPRDDCADEKADSPCWLFECHPSKGCHATTFVDGKSCNDGDPCTMNDLCRDLAPKPSACVGTPLPIDDGNACTDDSCESGGAVAHTPLDGVPCATGLAAAPLGTCGGGKCMPPEALECVTTADCGKADPCAGEVVCDTGSGECVVVPGTTVVCAPSADPCLMSQCNPTSGECAPLAAADGAACSDGSACTIADACSGGACMPGLPKELDDNDKCTIDACDPATGEVNHTATNGPCVDANACNGAETCTANQCQPGTPIGIDDGVDCTQDACDPATGLVTHSPVHAACDDGNACTKDTCGEAGCEAQATDGDPCPLGPDGSVAGVCIAGACEPPPVVCGNDADCEAEDLCAGTSTCDEESGQCVPVPNSAVVCEPAADPCVDMVCTPETGQCAPLARPDDSPCSDGTACTKGDHCGGGTCQPGAPVACDDQNPCNGVESCHSALGCVSGSPPVLSDGVGCTVDTCDPATGAVSHAPSNAACSNGNACDGVELCDPKAGCGPGTPLAVDDGIACTTDTCGAGGVITHAPSHAACSDGDACNGDEVCDASSGCALGAAKVLDDGLACTLDTCNPATGVVTHALSHALCDDDDACNGAEVCSAATGCGPGTPLSLSDGVGCTTDYCDSETGTLTHVPEDTLCDDDDPCTTDTCAASGCTNGPREASCRLGGTCSTADLCESGECVEGVSPYRVWSVAAGTSEVPAAAGVRVGPDGSVFAAGQVGYALQPGGYLRLLRFDPAAQTGPDSTQYRNEEGAAALYGVGLAADGGMLLAGKTGEADALIIRTAPSGEVSWQWSFTKNDEERLDAVVELPDGTIAGVGKGFTVAGSHYDGVAFLVTADGQAKSGLLSRGTKSPDKFTGVAPAGDDGFVAVGELGGQPGGYRAWFVRYAGDGAFLSERIYPKHPGATDEMVAAVAAHPDGGFLLVGHAAFSSSAFNQVVWRTTDDGAMVWSRLLTERPRSFSPSGDPLRVLPNGELLTGGAEHPVAGGSPFPFLARYSSNGYLIAHRQVTHVEGRLTGIDVFSDGSLALGVSKQGANGSDVHLERTDAWGYSSCAEAGACAELAHEDCDDGDPCTADDCDPATGCVHTASGGACCGKQSGATCDDGNPLTTGDSCVLGVCTGGSHVASRTATATFHVDATEVTQRQYQAFLNTWPDPAQDELCADDTSYAPRHGWDPAGAADYPVRGVDWCDARAFCQAAGKRLCSGSELGTGEWRAACGGIAGTAFPYGSSYSAGACVDATGSPTGPSAVASRVLCQGGLPGVFDLSGNVAEWTADCASDAGGGPMCDRVGGSFASGAALALRCDSVEDIAVQPDDTLSATTGFRCCDDGEVTIPVRVVPDVGAPFAASDGSVMNRGQARVPDAEGWTNVTLGADSTRLLAYFVGDRLVYLAPVHPGAETARVDVRSTARAMLFLAGALHLFPVGAQGEALSRIEGLSLDVELADLVREVLDSGASLDELVASREADVVAAIAGALEGLEGTLDAPLPPGPGNPPPPQTGTGPWKSSAQQGFRFHVARSGASMGVLVVNELVRPGRAILDRFTPAAQNELRSEHVPAAEYDELATFKSLFGGPPKVVSDGHKRLKDVVLLPGLNHFRLNIVSPGFKDELVAPGSRFYTVYHQESRRFYFELIIENMVRDIFWEMVPGGDYVDCLVEQARFAWNNYPPGTTGLKRVRAFVLDFVVKFAWDGKICHIESSLANKVKALGGATTYLIGLGTNLTLGFISQWFGDKPVLEWEFSFCQPNCVAKQCGDDGCGGSCGKCNGAGTCSSGKCSATCTDECAAGSSGCLSGTQKWICGQNDADSCREKVASTCGWGCESGQCKTACSDECTTAQKGCSGSGTRWFCGEKNDGDICLDVVTAACGSGTTCTDGTCGTNCACPAGKPCCDSCAFRGTDHVCQTAAQTSYGCPWGSGCGADAGRQISDRRCSGNSADCNGALVARSWEVADSCSDTEVCQSGNASCQSGGSCQTCTPNQNKSCYSGDLWWYDSCGTRGSLATSCGGAGCTGTSCNSGCPSNVCQTNGWTSGVHCVGNTAYTCGSSNGCAVVEASETCGFGCSDSCSKGCHDCATENEGRCTDGDLEQCATLFGCRYWIDAGCGWTDKCCDGECLPYSTPGEQTLVSPAANATTGTSITFQWAYTGSATRVTLASCTNVQLTTGCLTVEPPPYSTSYNWTLPKGVRYWSVRGIAACDHSAWSPYVTPRKITVN